MSEPQSEPQTEAEWVDECVHADQPPLTTPTAIALDAHYPEEEFHKAFLAIEAEAALLARRAPGDRATLEAENAQLRELLALRPSGHTGPLDDRIPWFIHCGISHGADRPECIVCRALATDSRPEQPRQEEPSEWFAEYRVHASQQEDGTWVSVPVADEAEGRDWLQRTTANGIVIEARLTRRTPTVVWEWAPVRPEEPPE